MSKAKKIMINDCHDCPYRDHGGGFGRVAYKPICRNMGRALPYDLVKGHGDMVIAHQTGGIPEWCPLEDD